jgi:dipeptidase D
LKQLPSRFHSFAKWFLALTEIPHGPFNPFPLSNQICAWCRSLSIPYEQDTYGNICARIPSHDLPATAPIVAIQAHFDMVHIGEFNNSDGINVSLDKTVLFAERSTLGADDGFGVALMLELLERHNELSHGPLELIFTADEEPGLYGVQKLPARDGSVDSPISIFNFRYLINCDSLCGDRVYVGCSGANQYFFRLEATQIIPENPEQKSSMDIHLSGLKGGHSGCCIHLNRMCATKVLARLLKCLISSGIEFELAHFSGGELINVISRRSHAVVVIESSKVDSAVNVLRHKSTEIFAEYESEDAEPVFEIAIKNEIENDRKILSFHDSQKFINLLVVLPHGCMRFSPFDVFHGDVDTSVNLAIVKCDENGVEVWVSIRGVVSVKVVEMEMMVKAAFKMCGLPFACEERCIAIPWVPNVESRLAAMMVESYERVNGVKKGIGLLPSTIETSAFVKLGYEEEMVAICPSVPLAHRIGEFVDLEECLAWRDAAFDLLARLVD